MMRVTLSNALHLECGQVTVSLPIPKEEYDQTIEMLRTVDLGFSVNRDCTVNEIDSAYSVLEALKGSLVNVDHLDYLAKRLDGFCESEATLSEDQNRIRNTLLDLLLPRVKQRSAEKLRDRDFQTVTQFLHRHNGNVPAADIHHTVHRGRCDPRPSGKLVVRHVALSTQLLEPCHDCFLHPHNIHPFHGQG